MSNIHYTQIAESNTNNILCSAKNHCSGHIRLFFEQNGLFYTILGHNEKYDNVTSFGGFADPGETLLDTLLREYMEESLGSITTETTMRNLLLDKCTLIHRRSVKGDHYTVFCMLNYVPDIKTIRENFKTARSGPNLNSGQKENDDIVFVSLDVIVSAFSENIEIDVCVKNSENNLVKIRGINMPAYKWFVDHLKQK